MTDKTTVESHGITLTMPARLLRFGDVGQDIFDRVVPFTISEVATLILPVVVSYPDEGDYNIPGPYPKRWYQRLFGPCWALEKGGVHGRNTSQQLQENWKQEIIDNKANSSLSTWTSVTYAPYVVGDAQSKIHEAHGWRTAQSITDEFAEIAQEILSDAIDHELENLDI